MATSVVFLSESPAAQIYYTNVMSALDGEAFRTPEYIATPVINEGGPSYSLVNDNPYLMNFSVENDPAEAYAYAGDQGKEIMKFRFKSHEQTIEMNTLKLKLEGIDPKLVDAVTITEKVIDEEGNEVDRILQMGRRVQEYVEFMGLGYRVEKGESKEVSIRVDLNSEAPSGKRFRLDVEQASDLGLMLGGKPYQLKQYYPMRGKYLSVVKAGIN